MSDIFDAGRKLPLMEDFYTIQGEGYHTGKPAYFIRVGGCDIGCHWCDTKMSWNPHIHKLIAIKEIVSKVMKLPVQSVVVTGGEPTTYNLEPLTTELKANGIEAFIETSGSYKLTGEWDWICFSPKRESQKKPESEFYNVAHELKIIIFDDEDFEWAEYNANLVNGNCKLYLQPEWSRYEKNILKIVEYVKNNPKWNISLQIHKFMHIP
jgi:7-carboxy-7-deazaguanine synthase